MDNITHTIGLIDFLLIVICFGVLYWVWRKLNVVQTVENIQISNNALMQQEFITNPTPLNLVNIQTCTVNLRGTIQTSTSTLCRYLVSAIPISTSEGGDVCSYEIPFPTNIGVISDCIVLGIHGEVSDTDKNFALAYCYPRPADINKSVHPIYFVDGFDDSGYIYNFTVFVEYITTVVTTKSASADSSASQ